MIRGARRWYAKGRVVGDVLPKRVQRDTLEWRKEADLVLGYIDDNLRFDSNSHVLTMDLLDDINRWLVDRGHHKWSDKTLVARFGEHDEVVRNRVRRDRARKGEGLSRPPYRSGVTDPFAPANDRAVPEPYRAWLGIRFVTESDMADD
jgi:putative DNA primase/helicase